VIATDVDGTLIPPGHKEPNAEAIKVLRKVNEKGVKWILATGKSRRGAIESLTRGEGGEGRTERSEPANVIDCVTN